MAISVKTAGGKSVEVNEAVFGQEYNEALIHQIVTAFMAGARQGSKQQKNRSDVSGSNIKPWRQKGTGRARAGSRRSPIWRAGGVTFAARPRSYDQKVNRKMYRTAIRSILSELVRSERLIGIDSISCPTPKTKDLLANLQQWGVGTHALIVTNEADMNLMLAARNLPHVDVCTAAEVDPICLIGYDKILMTVDAIKQIEEKLQ